MPTTVLKLAPHFSLRRSTRLALHSMVLCLCALAHGTELQLLTEENPPLNFSENGQLKGLSIDVVQEIQRRVGNTNSIEIQPWARAYRTASTVPNVALFIMARTPAREDLFQWVGPVSASIASLYGRQGSGLRITNLDEARAVERILVVRDFYTHQLLQKLGFTNLELVPKPETMVKMAVNGRAPVMFAANVTLADLLEKAGAKRSDVELLYTITSLQTYIGFSLGTPKEVVAKWQVALDSMKRDGSYANIYAKWLPGETPTKIKPEPNISP
nr:transporter substrate-binding domain-containing protein [uncultured Rhodoferax sp.]